LLPLVGEELARRQGSAAERLDNPDLGQLQAGSRQPLTGHEDVFLEFGLVEDGPDEVPAFAEDLLADSFLAGAGENLPLGQRFAELGNEDEHLPGRNVAQKVLANGQRRGHGHDHEQQ